jgi:hypothetical protein
MVTGTGPLGCAPAEIAMRSKNGECASELQQAALIFNSDLAQLIQQLNIELGADVFVSADAFQMIMDFINNPQAFGLFCILYIYPTHIAYSYIYGKVSYPLEL